MSPRARWMWFVVEFAWLSVTIAVGLIVMQFWSWLADHWWIVAVLVLFQAVSLVAAPVVRYRVYRWEVTDTAIYVQSGWLSIERTIVPLSRIQTVEYSQGVLARVFGLASVSITTASTAGSAEIVGLERPAAVELTDELTVKADLDDGDAT